MQFIDIQAQTNRIREKIDNGINLVLNHGQFIMGPEVTELEEQLCQYTGSKHCITCANGTDALKLALMASGISKNDVVFTTSFSFFATAEMIPLLGAIPYFVDVDPQSYNLDAEHLQRAITDCKKKKVGVPKAVIAVDLFGLPAQYQQIRDICDREGLTLISDAAQSFGASINNVKAGNFGEITTTSFFPAKPLGCFGDGGALFTNNDNLCNRLKSLRVHGKGKHKYDNVNIGVNSRLDTIQAAVLLEKLKLVDEERSVKRDILSKYKIGLSEQYHFQHTPAGFESGLAICAISSKVQPREQVLEKLRNANVPYQIYYQTPIHNMLPMKNFPNDGCHAATRLSEDLFSIPLHAYLNEADIHKIIKTLVN